MVALIIQNEQLGTNVADSVRELRRSDSTEVAAECG